MTGKKRAEPAEVQEPIAGAESSHDDSAAQPETDPNLAELARLRAREDELLRALAEQQNVLRRRRQEMDASLRYAQEDLVREILPVLDDFERAIRAGSTGNAEPIRAGVQLVHDRLAGILERQGLSAIRPVGEPFDPAVHDAIAQRPEPGKAPGTILEVIEPGYRLRDRVLRHAKVVVAGPSHTSEPPGEDRAVSESGR